MSENHKVRTFLLRLESYDEFFKFNRKSDEDTIELLQAKNARWRITLYMMIGMRDGQKSILIDEWQKPAFVLSKDERILILNEMIRIGLAKALTQEIIGVMLGVSTSTIQKDLADIFNDAKSLPSGQ